MNMHEPPRCLSAARGFTLIELVVALLILGILVSVGVPTFSEATLGSRLNSAATSLSASLFLARSEAIKRNTVVRVCPSTDGDTCTSSSDWETGWIVMVPEVGSNPAVILERQSAFGGSVRVLHKNAALSSTLTSAVDMPPSGIRTGASAEAFLICRATPSPGKQERVINVSATGKPSVKRTETGSCS